MNTKTNGRLYKWEAALLVALCITLIYGLWEQSRQNDLAEQVIRLHVVAESDSREDQAVKLKVRDEILKLLEPALDKQDSAEGAAEAIEELLPTIEDTARRTALMSGAACNASASLGREGFPTRNYDGFALPAGEYLSLRVTLGEGAGHNWWCVVFPPLCAASAEESQEAFEKLDGDSAAMIIDGDSEYKVGFKILELFEQLREILG